MTPTTTVARLPNSTRPVGEALRALLDERNLSLIELERRTKAIDGSGISHEHLSLIADFHDPISEHTLELLAQVLEVEPTHFAEYRLARLRDMLDPGIVGFDQAVDFADSIA